MTELLVYLRTSCTPDPAQGRRAYMEDWQRLWNAASSEVTQFLRSIDSEIKIRPTGMCLTPFVVITECSPSTRDRLLAMRDLPPVFKGVFENTPIPFPNTKPEPPKEPQA